MKPSAITSALALSVALGAPPLAEAATSIPANSAPALGACGSGKAKAEPPARAATLGNPQARAAAQRGLDFLAAAALKWQKQNQCNGCHVQSVTLEALSVGIHNQYKVQRPSLQAIAEGMLNLSGGGRKKGGLSYQEHMYLGSAKAFGGAAFARYDQWVDGDLRHDLLQVAGELLSFQDQDGSVRSDYPNNLPVSVGPVQRAYQAAQTWRQAHGRTADDKWLPPIQRAESFLQQSARSLQQQPSASIQEINYSLLGMSAAGVGAGEAAVRALHKQVLERQNHDGGWGYAKGQASNAFATGQTLYALRTLGQSDKDGPIERGTAWLVQSQQKDGGWGGGGFGKAEAMWGVLGLVSVDVLSVAVGGIVDGQRVEEAMALSVEAKDNQGQGVTQVELRIDDLPVARACKDKLSHSWDTTKLGAGKHTLDLWATNARGQVSRRRLEVYAGDVFLTQIGAQSEATGLVVSLRNIAPKSDGTVELQILRANGNGAPEGAPLATLSQAAAAGAMRLSWDGKAKDGKMAPPGKYFARLHYLGVDKKMRQREDVLFVRDSVENQRAGYGEIQGQLRMKRAIAEGAPAAAANARVDLVDDRGNVVQSVRSTSEGQYRFKNVDAGKYKVRVQKEGFAPAERPVNAAKAAEAAAPLDL